MPETIQAYLEAVREQIRWKRARPVLIRELGQHLEDQRDAFLQEGKSPEEAERLAVEDMGDPVTVGTELDAVHRPRPQWGLLGLTFALAAVGVILRVMFRQPWPRLDFIVVKALASLALGTAAMLGMYFFDVARLARHAKVLYLSALFLGAGMYWYSVCQAPFLSPSFFSRFYYFAQFLPLLYALWVYSWRGNGWKGIFLAILGGVPVAVICAIYPSMANLSVLLLSGFVLMLLAVWQDWFGVGRRKGLAPVFGTAFALLVYLFFQGYFHSLMGRLQTALHPEQDKGFGWAMRMFWKNIPPFQNHLNSFGISAAVGIRGPDSQEAAMRFGHDFLPTAMASAWGWVPFLFLLAALAVLLLWLLVKGLRQSYLLGRFVVLAAVVPLAVQLLFSLSLNLGFVLFSASMPLIVGNLQTVIDMALIGLALSVFRGESIAREEPEGPLPQRKRLRLRIEYQ